MSVTFIHAADLHLDRPFLGIDGCGETMKKRVRESTFSAFSRLIQTAIARKVDFILLAGDIFDGETRGLRAETQFKALIRPLADYDIAVYMLHGNHDPLDRHWSGLTYGEHVQIFGPSPERKTHRLKNGQTVNIYGFSYGSRHIPDNMIALYKKEPGADYHIAMLHGSLKGNSDHDVYAPFTLSDLLAKDMDYWALGHIHKRAVLNDNPPIIYPGSLQGLSAKETGEKGFYIVTLHHGHTKTEFIKTSGIIWETAELDVTGVETFDELVKRAEQKKEEHRKKQDAVLLRLVLTGEASLIPQTDSDLLEVLRVLEDERENFVWVTEIRQAVSLPLDRSKLASSSHFIGDIIRLIDQKQTVVEDVAMLYGHHRAKKYLTPLTDVDQRQLLEEAEKLILMGLTQQNSPHR